MQADTATMIVEGMAKELPRDTADFETPPDCEADADGSVRANLRQVINELAAMPDAAWREYGCPSRHPTLDVLADAHRELAEGRVAVGDLRRENARLKAVVAQAGLLSHVAYDRLGELREALGVRNE